MSKMYRSAFSNYCRSELEFSMSLPNDCPSHLTRCRVCQWRCRMQAGDVVLFGDSGHVYGYQNIACRTETYRKKTRLYPFWIHLCRSAHQSHHLSLCRIVKESAVMVAVLIVLAAVIFIAPYERILSELQTFPFLVQCFFMWLYCFTGTTSQYVCTRGRWEGFEILLKSQYDPQQPIDFLFAWKWFDFNQCDERY